MRELYPEGPGVDENGAMASVGRADEELATKVLTAAYFKQSPPKSTDGPAMIASRWVPGALRYSAGGLAVGGVLGLAGFALTRWERRGGVLLYTPNRWLVLAVTLVVATRVVYGFWRTWQTWRRCLHHFAPLVFKD